MSRADVNLEENVDYLFMSCAEVKLGENVGYLFMSRADVKLQDASSHFGCTAGSNQPSATRRDISSCLSLDERPVT
jgi:hypothetical protein